MAKTSFNNAPECYALRVVLDARKIIIQMRITLRFALLILFGSIGYVATAQVTYYSRGSGNWNDVNTWSVVSHSGAVAPQIPGGVAGSSSTDLVEIASGHTVTLDIGREIGGLTIGASLATGTLIIGNDNINRTLTVRGPVLVNALGTLSRNTSITTGEHLLEVVGDNGNFTNDGTVNFTDETRPAGGWSSVNVEMEVGGNVNLTGSVLATSKLNNLTINKNNRSIKLGSNWTVAGMLYIQAGYLELGDAATQYTLNGNSTASFIRIDINGVLRIFGTASFPTGYLAVLEGDDGTVEYAGTNQTIAPVSSVTQFHNLIISGTGTKTLSSATIIDDKLTISPGTALSTANYTITERGDFANNGTFTPGTTGTVIFSGTRPQIITGTASFRNIQVDKATTLTAVFANTPLSVATNTTLTQGTLDLGTITTHTLGTVSGSGTIALSAAAAGTTVFPTGTFTAFLTAAGTGTVEYNNTVNYTIGTAPLAYAYLKISGASTKTLSTTIAVTKDININQGATLSTAANTITLTGNFINDGTFTGTGTVNFNNTGAIQTISGLTSTTFYNVTVSKAAAYNLVLANTARIDGTLALANAGNVELGSYNLTIGATGNITGSGGAATIAAFSNTRMILQDGTNSSNGSLVREGTTAAGLVKLFPIGTGTIYSYANITQLTGTVTATASLAVKAIPFSTSSNNMVRRFWRIKATNLSSITDARLVFKYDPTDITNSGSPTLVVKRFANNVENDVTGSFVDNTTTQTFGVNAAGNTFVELEWRMGDPANFAKTYYSYQSGAWDTPNTWTTDPTGTILQGQPGAGGPNNGDRVVVLNGRTVTMAVSNKTLTSLEIESGATVDVQTTSGHNFGTIRGAGLLRIANILVPSGNYLEFVAPTGGTIEYYNYNGGLATNIPYYNNVIMSGTGTKVIGGPTRTITVNGNFSVTGGTALIGFGSGNKLTVNIYGDVTIAAGASVTIGNDQIHDLIFYKDLVNNGSIDITNAAQYADATGLGAANLTMKGTSDNSISGTGSKFDLYKLIVDKGVDQTYILDVNATNLLLHAPTGLANGSTSAPYSVENPEILKALWVKNGTLKLGSNINIPRLSSGGNDFFIPEHGAIWLNGATVATYDSPTGSPGNTGLTLYGKLRVTSGTWNGNGSAGIVYRTISEIIVEGGIVTVSQLRASTGGTGPANNRSAYVQSGGEFIVTGTGEQNASFSMFSLDKTSSIFRMSGGIIRVRNATTTGAIDIRADLANFNVSGGLVEITTNSSNSHQVRSTVPLYNVTTIKGSSTGNIALSTNELVVLNDITIGTNTSFNANNLDLTVGHNFACQGTGVYTPGTNTTIFNSKTSNQTASCASGLLFNNLTIDNTYTGGVVTLSGNLTTTLNGNLNLNNGTLNDGGETVTVKGNISNSALHTGTGRVRLNNSVSTVSVLSGSGTGIFGNLELSDADGATLSVDQTVAGTLTLTTGVLDIKQYNLNFTETGTISVTTPGSTRMIKTAGNRSDGGIKKTFNATGSFTFPLGVTGKYTPVAVTLTAASVFGSIAINPVNTRHPFVTSNNSLNYYWEVRATGFTGTRTLSYGYTYVTGDVTGTESQYIGGFYDVNAPSVWTTTPNTVNTGTHTANFNNVSYIAGEYTAGVPAAFSAVTVYYSRVNGNWETPATWSTTGFNGAAAAGTPGSANPVFIGDGATYNHTVTVTTNTRTSGNLKLNSGSVLDLGTTTGHNFGAAVGERVKGNGKLRISSAVATAQFPAGDFGEFIDIGGGTVEYYRTLTDFKLPTVSANPTAMSLANYNQLILSPLAGNISLPDINLTIFNDLSVSAVTGTGKALISNTSSGVGNLDIQHDLIVAGMLQFQNGQTRTVNVDNQLTISAGGTFSVSNAGTAVANQLTLNGSMVNNGTFEMSDGGRYCDVIFMNDVNATVTGTGALTDFNRLVVSKGTSQTPLLEVNLSNFTLSGVSTSATKALDLQNGTFKLTSTQTLTVSSGTNGSDYPIPYTSQLWLNGGNIRITTTGTGAGLLLGGKLRIDAGTFYIEGGGTNDNYVEIAGGNVPAIEVNGGELRVGSQIRRANTSTISALSYAQTAGTVTIGTQTATNTNRALLEVLNNGSVFVMSGGTLIIARQQTGTPTIAALYLQPSSSSVTGGTIQLGSTAYTPTGQNIQIYSSIPVYDVVVNSTNSPTVTLTVGDLTVRNNFTIGTGSTFAANDFGVYLQGNFVVNGTYTPGNNTTYFSSPSKDQALSGAAAVTFKDLAISNTKVNGVVSLNVNVIVAGTLYINTGVLDDNTRTISVKGRVNNYSTHKSGGAGTGRMIFNGTSQQTLSGNGQGALGNVEFNNALGVWLENQHTIEGVMTFTNGVFNIRSEHLVLGTAASVAGTPGVTSMIQTNGTLSDQGVAKNFATGIFNFTFPIGTAGKYTTARFQASANTAPGTITIKPVDRQHPSVTVGYDALQYYWNVNSTGFAGLTLQHYYTYHISDVNGNENIYVAARFTNDWVKGSTVGTVTPASHLITINGGSTGVNYIAGDYTAGDPLAFQSISTFITAQNGDWDTGSTWVGGVVPSTGSPVIINNNHAVTLSTSTIPAPNSKTTFSMEIRSGARLIINNTTYGHNFGNVSGIGTLSLSSGTFPGGAYGQFVNSSGGTVEYTGSGYTLSTQLLYNNITLNATGTVALANVDIGLRGNLIINSGVLNNASSNRRISIQGNWTNNVSSAAFAAGTGAVEFTGTQSQTIGGTSDTQFNALEMNKSTNNVTLARNIGISTSMKFTQGSIVTNAFKVNANPSVAINRSNGHVIGYYAQNVAATGIVFPVGTANSYLPLTLTFSTGASVVTASVAAVNPTVVKSSGGDPNNPLVALWTIEPTAFPVGAEAVAVFQYPDNVRQSGFQQNLAYAARWNTVTTSWQSFRLSSVASPNDDPSRVTVTGITQFSDWAIFNGSSDAPLPVVLTTFNAVREHDHIVLRWSTASEINADHFGIEKSWDGKRFYPVGKEKALGTSGTGADYQMIDSEITAGVTYYRLYQVDYDGRRNDHNIVAVSVNAEPWMDEFIVYPNPTHEQIHIRSRISAGYTRAVLYDLTGKLFYTETLTDFRFDDQLDIDMSDLDAGVYVLKIGGAERMHVYKVVKY